MSIYLVTNTCNIFWKTKNNVQFNFADERILEYDIDEVLFEEKSPYQKVQIVHSKSFGNLLLLDDLQSKLVWIEAKISVNNYLVPCLKNGYLLFSDLSEKDIIYTETLMQRGKEDYRGKEIVILGGGDGGLLWELLKEEPKFVTMLEVSETLLSDLDWLLICTVIICTVEIIKYFF